MASVSRSIHCPSARLPGGWADGVLLTVDEGGTITGIRTGVPAAEVPGAVRLPGPTLPGMPNLHSHAFQRAIAGITQQRGPGDDSFWTWREAMYASLDGIDPDATEAIAAAVYVELLEGGFTSTAEFHYVHHQSGGQHHPDSAELSWRIVAAAEATGMGLLHLPVLYLTGGFDGRPLSARQARFGWSVEGILGLRERVAARLASDPRRTTGLALHSLRAVPPKALHDAVDGLRSASSTAPIHIHISEQTAEVEACLALRGARPVAWLCDHAPVDERWCLVHATHIDAAEQQQLLDRQAIAGLCPTTEADLGDGLFPADAWVRSGGVFGVGTDSHVGRTAAGELRLLEYGQRLTTRRRNVLSFAETPHTGAGAWLAAARGGAKALGLPAGGLEVGRLADLVSLDPSTPGLVGVQGDAVVDALVFGGAPGALHTVVAGGRVLVEGGRHVRRAPIMARFAAVLRRLRASV